MGILTIEETKKRIIDFLYSRGEYVRLVHGDPEIGGEFQTRCPYCGDSQKQFNTGHFYLKIITNNNYVIPTHCFKCENTGGIFTKETLELMGCEDEDLLNGIVYLNKKGKYQKGVSGETGLYRYFERNYPKEYRYIEKLNYINNRLGINFLEENYKEMKVITSLYDFMIENHIEKSPFKKYMRILLEKDYVGFLSSGNSHILFRDITEKNEYRWIKYPIDEESARNKVFYALDTSLDIFTKEEITINLSEGVFDILGISNHLDKRKKNVLNIAVCGQNYNSMILHLIDLGVIGGNVTLNIYSDNDEMFSDNKNKTSSEKRHRKYLEKYVPLFKEINLFYNLKGKDYGVRKEKIILKKIKI